MQFIDLKAQFNALQEKIDSSPQGPRPRKLYYGPRGY